MGDNENPEVIVLFNGYSEDHEDYTLANCTCTLIKGQSNIIIDTMTPWDGDKLKEALSNNGLNSDDINYVVCTHGHSDHVGCNYLFPKAIHIVGHCVSQGHKYFDHDFKKGDAYVINDKVKVRATPGHTMQDVSVFVETDDGMVVVAGDLFERKEDLDDESIWISAGSDSEDYQRMNRNGILLLADYVVPGHGPMFKVPKERLPQLLN